MATLNVSVQEQSGLWKWSTLRKWSARQWMRRWVVIDTGASSHRSPAAMVLEIQEPRCPVPSAKLLHQQNSKTHTKVKNSGDSVNSSGIPVEFRGIPWHSMPILFPNPECPDLQNSMEFHRNAPEFTGINRILYFLSFADANIPRTQEPHHPSRRPSLRMTPRTWPQR